MGALLGAAGSLLGGLFGGEKELQPFEGFKTSGWTSDIAPKSTPSEPATEPEEPRDKESKVDQWLGSNVGKIAQQIGGSKFADAQSRKARKDRFSDLKAEGLTAQEIAGGGGAGGAVTTQGNTLGSGPAQQVKSQQQFTREENMKDRENKEKIAEITARGPGMQARTGRMKYELEAQIAPKQRALLDQNIRKVRADVKRAKFDLKNIWAMKFASMSMENGMFAVAAFNSGMDLKAILQAGGTRTEKERKESEEFYNIMLKTTGAPGKALGFLQVIKQITGGRTTFEGRDEFQTLGRIKKGVKREWDIYLKDRERIRKDKKLWPSRRPNLQR